MDLRQLEMLIAVADNAGFRRAAEQLHISQSAISRKIRMLEEEVTVPVFKRVNKKFAITPAGRTLIKYARRVFQELRNASLEIAEMDQLKRGKLRVGAGLIACTYILPPVLEKFGTLHPCIELDVVTARTDALLTMLRDNALDMAVLTLPVPQAGLKVVHLRYEEMVVIASTKHPQLSKRQWIRAEEIQQYPLIALPRDAHTRWVQEDFFQRAGIVPRIAMAAENVATIKPLVAINLGISIVPLCAVVAEARRKELHYLRIRNHKLVREQGLVYNMSDAPPPILAELIRLFKEREDDLT